MLTRFSTSRASAEIDATKDDIRVGDGLDHSGIDQVGRIGLDDRTEFHRRDSTRRDRDLFSGVFCVAPGGVENAIEVLALDDLGIDENDAAEAEARQLLNDDAAGSGGADNDGRKPAEFGGHAMAERGCCSSHAVDVCGRRRRRVMPDLDVVAGDHHQFDRMEFAGGADCAAEHRTVAEHDEARMRHGTVDESMDARKE